MSQQPSVEFFFNVPAQSLEALECSTQQALEALSNHQPDDLLVGLGGLSRYRLGVSCFRDPAVPLCVQAQRVAQAVERAWPGAVLVLVTEP
jgi:hypothetical protein